MKKIIIILFLLLLIISQSNEKMSVESDKIPVLGEVYFDGKKGYNIYLEIHIIKEKNKITWYLNEVKFIEDLLNKDVIISIQHSRSNDVYDLPLLENIRWIPGEIFECKYGVEGRADPIDLKATKVKGKQYDWEVYGKGKYKMPPEDPNGKEHIIELKSVKEINLKYKKLRMPSLYYK